MNQQKQDWNIRSRNEVCSRCAKAFEDNEPFYSRLTFGEAGYLREDFCADCWEEVSGEPALSLWQGIFRIPPPPPPEALRKETAESLLRKLIEQDDPGTLNTIYILAIMLERRRILVEKDVQIREDGSKLRIYEYRKTNEVFLITDPELKLAELEHVQTEVVALLGGGGDQEVAPEAPTAEPGEEGASQPESV